VETQLQWLEKAAVFQHSLLAKLREFGEERLLNKIGQCHQSQTVLTCRCCGERRVVDDRCNVRWCCYCGPRIARRRSEEIAIWSKQLAQPKHVVLTARNTDLITRKIVRKFAVSLYKLRRRKWQPEWSGGTWALEITNEGRGWHLHAHMLIEARWIDAARLSKLWGRAMGQEFAIVKVKDARSAEYCAEVAKYVAKPAQVTSWQPNEIVEVIHAFNRVRVFGVFGKLIALRAQWNSLLKQQRHERGACECGECAWRVVDSRIAEMRDVVWDRKPTRPTPAGPKLGEPRPVAHEQSLFRQ